MAFIPDEAIDRSHEIGGAGFRLYAIYCEHRDGVTGVCWPSLKLCAAKLKTAYSYVSELRSKLIEQGWIEITEHDQIRPLVGFGKPETSFGKAEVASEKPNTPTEESSEKPKEVSEKPKQEFGKTEMHIRNNQPNEPNQITKGNTPLPPPANDQSEARGEFTLCEQSLLGIFGWGLAPGPSQAEQVRNVAAHLANLAAHYGDDYVPLPARVARFPDFARHQGFKRWGPQAVMNHWKRAVDWMNSGDSNGGTNGLDTSQTVAGSLPSESGTGGKWAAREF